MIYGYIRVSSDKQTVENQRSEISRYVRDHKLGSIVWVEETISGKVDFRKRKLGSLLNRLRAGDLLICSELSRLARSLFMLIGILNRCLNRGIRIQTVRDRFHLGDDLNSKVIAFAFGLSAEIERNLISQRTREALRRLKLEGRRLGRPFLLDKHKEEVSALVGKCTQAEIARRFGVSQMTVWRYVHRCLGVPCRRRVVFGR